MTYKFVGVLRSLTDDKPYQRTAIWIGVGIGPRDRAAAQDRGRAQALAALQETRTGGAVDFVLDSTLLPSPYALSFGGFVNLPTSLWLGAGGVVASLIETRRTRKEAPGRPCRRT